MLNSNSIFGWINALAQTLNLNLGSQIYYLVLNLGPKLYSHLNLAFVIVDKNYDLNLALIFSLTNLRVNWTSSYNECFHLFIFFISNVLSYIKLMTILMFCLNVPLTLKWSFKFFLLSDFFSYKKIFVFAKTSLRKLQNVNMSFGDWNDPTQNVMLF